MGKIRIGACALCAVLSVAMFSGSLSANANDSIADKQQQVNDIRKANEKRKQEIDALGDDISDNEEAMELIGEQIDGYLAEIAAYGELVTEKQTAVEQKKAEIEQVENNIAYKENEIELKKSQIAELQAQNDLNLEQFGKLARYMYMNNMSTQLPVLNGSDDWYDYFVYSDVVNNITEQTSDFMDYIMSSIKRQEELIAEFNSEIQVLEAEKAELEKEKVDLEQEEADLESTMADLERNTDQKRGEINSLVEKNDAFKDKIAGLKISIAEAEAQMEELNAEIEKLIREAQANRDPDMPDYSGESLIWPLDPQHNRITTYFGYDPWRGGNHGGIDVWDSWIHGATVYAAQSGYITTTSFTCTHNEPKNGWTCGCGGNFGNYIIIDHGGNLATLYGHLQAIYVSPGQFVKQGDAIGEVGSTGWSTDYHLHFETREYGVRVDPRNYLNF